MTDTEPMRPIIMMPNTNDDRPTGRIIDGKLYLTIADYAKSTGLGHRTVTRYIGEDEIPGVVREPDGNKRIFVPADARRVKGGKFPTRLLNSAGDGFADEMVSRPADGGVAMAPALPPIPKNHTSLAELLDAEPAHIPLDRASMYCGLTVHWLRSNQDRYGIIPGGDNGRLVMPKREILRAAGLID